jgi:uncharacterized protein YuzB (UPF0349 family)
MSSPCDHLRNLLEYQRPNVIDVDLYGRLTFEDLKRIDLFVSGDPIKSDSCSLFIGKKVGKYSPFCYRGKKVSLLRILSHNFCKDIHKNDVIEYHCINKGICCNIKHFTVVSKNQEIIEKSEKRLENKENDENIFEMD